jgi:hypothetical protein
LKNRFPQLREVDENPTGSETAASGKPAVPARAQNLPKLAQGRHYWRALGERNCREKAS